MFERGFKTWCERYAGECRAALSLSHTDRLDMRGLAAHLGVRVWTPHEVPGLSAEAFEVLLRNDGVTPSCWSAVTLVVGARVVVILNSSHSPARQASDLAHELAHRIRGHAPEKVSISEGGLMLVESYAREWEEEADWLAGCLLLPRDALIHIKKSGIADADAMMLYCVSQRMLSYRMNRTGVAKQFENAA